MALTVFCPQAKEKGPCQTPIECSGRLMCAHLKAMLDEASKDKRHSAALHEQPKEKT